EACQGGLPVAEVRVHPALKLSFSLKVEANTRVEAERAGKPETSLNVALKGGYEWGDQTNDLGAKLEDLPLYKNSWLAHVQQASDYVKTLAHAAGDVEVTFPNVAIELEAEAEIAEESHAEGVGCKYEVSLKCEPLLGATAKLDFLNVLIAAAGNSAAAAGIAVGPFLAQ